MNTETTWERSFLATEMLNQQKEIIEKTMGGFIACEVRLDEGAPVAYCVGYQCPDGGYSEVSDSVRACSRALSALLDGSPWEPSDGSDHSMPSYGGGYGVKINLRKREKVSESPATAGFRLLKSAGLPEVDLQFLRNMSKTPWYGEIEAFALSKI